ncbi:MAG: rhodanese-like domain-containing protein [Thermodesulfovibrionales bacterium]
MRISGMVSVFALTLLVCGNVFAVETDTDKVRAAADEFLSSVPKTGYLLSADELTERMKSGKKDFVIVDVREAEEKYKAGHIPGSIFIKFTDIAKPENLAKLDKAKDIIVYCNTGHEENKALAALRMLGYKAFGLKFGYMSWKKEKPTEMTLKAIENAEAKNYPVE